MSSVGTKTQRRWRSLLGLLLVFVCSDLYAAKPTDETWEQSLISDNIAISNWFDGIAEGIDLFLAGKKMTNRKNETKVIIEPSFYYSKKDGYSDATTFAVNLRLPNVEEYWQLTFSSYDETKERGVSQGYLRQTARDRDYGATLGFFRNLGKVRASFQPRISFAGRFKISHSAIFESVAEHDGYRVNPKFELYADADKGTGIFQALNFNIQLSRILSVTFVNEADYEDRIHYLTVTNGVAFGHWLNPDMQLGYNLFFTSINRPNYQLEQYVFSLSWTHILYKNILDYQIIPHLDFSQDDWYTGDPGIIFNLFIRF